MKILVVEDDEKREERQHILDLLSKDERLTVTEARSYRSGLESALERSFDLVISKRSLYLQARGAGLRKV